MSESGESLPWTELGQPRGRNSELKSFEKISIRFSVATGTTTSIMRNTGWLWGGEGMEHKCVNFTLLEFCLELRDLKDHLIQFLHFS